MLPWPLSTVHLLPLSSPPPLSCLSFLLSTSSFPYASHTSLLWGFLLYCPAPRLHINANKSMARLNIKRQRIEAQVGSRERKRTRKTDHWAFRARQHGWENSSRKCDGWVGDFAPLSSERDYTWHRSDTSGQLIYFRVKKRERTKERKKWTMEKRLQCALWRLYGFFTNILHCMVGFV